MEGEPRAERFIEKLSSYQSDEERQKLQRYFKTGEGEYGEGDQFLGVRMGQVFQLARESIDMPIAEIEKLLLSPLHEVRAGALSIMDKQARRKKTPASRRKELYDLYMRRIDRINNWDLVDVSAVYVVGGYLFDKPRDVLYDLARSENLWARRTAMVSTFYFLRQGQTEDTFRIAEMLLNDPEDLIHKAVGWGLREAGRVDSAQMDVFLTRYAATMPRTALRYALEKHTPQQRAHYMGMKKKQGQA